MKYSYLILAAAALTGLTAGLSFSGQDTGKAALISLDGTITPSTSGFSSGITPEKVRNLNEKALNRGADAVIYEINSGGGAVVASKDVKREIEDVDVPTVCRIRDVGASGAYLFSLGCDSIVADSASMTGSIGVTSSYLEYTGLMEKLGVDYVNITAGEYKSLGSPFQNLSEEEKEILESKANKIGEEFAQSVKNERNLSNTDFATGEVFLGETAREKGLVDRLGGRQAAVNEAETLTGKELETFDVDGTTQFSLLNLFAPGLNLNSGSILQARL